jgi:hypothetical protein
MAALSHECPQPEALKWQARLLGKVKRPSIVDRVDGSIVEDGDAEWDESICINPNSNTRINIKLCVGTIAAATSHQHIWRPSHVAFRECSAENLRAICDDIRETLLSKYVAQRSSYLEVARIHSCARQPESKHQRIRMQGAVVTPCS